MEFLKNFTRVKFFGGSELESEAGAASAGKMGEGVSDRPQASSLMPLTGIAIRYWPSDRLTGAVDAGRCDEVWREISEADCRDSR